MHGVDTLEVSLGFTNKFCDLVEVLTLSKSAIVGLKVDSSSKLSVQFHDIHTTKVAPPKRLATRALLRKAKPLLLEKRNEQDSIWKIVRKGTCECMCV